MTDAAPPVPNPPRLPVVADGDEQDTLEALRSVATFLAGTVLAPAAPVLDQAAAEIERLRAETGHKMPEVRLCGKRPHHLGEPCDRRAGHKDMHSWQIANMVRIRSDYDLAVSQLRQARHDLAEYDRRLRLAEADRTQLLRERESRRWRLPIPRRRHGD